MNAKFTCEFCLKEHDVLYEGWFYTLARLNPYAQGTVSAGMMQLRRACRRCTEAAIDIGLACATSIPEEVSNEV